MPWPKGKSQPGIPVTEERLKAKFFANIEKLDSGCWMWRGSIISGRYGLLRVGKYGAHNFYHETAHRFSYRLHKGEIPIGGNCVCHHCDTPACVNPDHLFIGTSKDNQQDMIKKGRKRVGEEVTNHKLTECNVRQIRELRQRGYTYRDLGEIFEIAPVTANRVVNRKAWAHVDREGIS